MTFKLSPRRVNGKWLVTVYGKRKHEKHYSKLNNESYVCFRSRRLFRAVYKAERFAFEHCQSKMLRVDQLYVELPREIYDWV